MLKLFRQLPGLHDTMVQWLREDRAALCYMKYGNIERDIFNDRKAFSVFSDRQIP